MKTYKIISTVSLTGEIQHRYIFSFDTTNLRIKSNIKSTKKIVSDYRIRTIIR